MDLQAKYDLLKKQVEDDAIIKVKQADTLSNIRATVDHLKESIAEERAHAGGREQALTGIINLLLERVEHLSG